MTSDEARKTAARLWELTEQCAETLTDPAKRRIFDERLAWFKKERPELVSKNGSALISQKYTRVSLKGLLGEADAQQLLAHEKLVTSFVNFQPRQVTIMERAYRDDPTDIETREAYRDVLVNGMTHYDLSQDGVWSEAGVAIGTADRKTRIYLEDVSEGIEARIQGIADSLERRVSEHYGLLESGLTKPLLLTGAVSSSGMPNESQVVATPEDVLEKLQDNLKRRTNRLGQLALKQQELMGKLLDTMDIWMLNEESKEADMPSVYLMRANEEGELRCLTKLSVNTQTSALEVDRDFAGKTIEELKELVGIEPAVAMETHDEIKDYPIYLTFLMNKLAKQKEGHIR